MIIPQISPNMSMLQYLIEMGAQGNHVLFEAGDIRRAFKRDMDELAEIDSNTVGEVNKAIQQMIEIEEIDDKRDFFQELKPLLQDILIHLYFQMIDRTLFRSRPDRH